MTPRALLLTLLALSPIAFVVGSVAAWIALSYEPMQIPWLAVPGYVVLYGALCALSFSPLAPRSAAIRRWVWLALGSGMLLVVAVVFRRATEFWLEEDGPPRIVLEQIPFGIDAYRVNGLNVRWGPSIKQGPPGAAWEFSVEMSGAGGVEGNALSAAAPRLVQADGFGNSLTFQLLRPGVMRIDDNLGGFAEIDWNGPAPVVARSQAMPRTAEARGPASIGYRLSHQGPLIAFATPFISWWLFTMALERSSLKKKRAPTNLFRLPRLLLSAGLGLFILLMLAEWAPQNALDKLMLEIVIAAPTCLGLFAGSLWSGWILLTNRSEIDWIWSQA